MKTDKQKADFKYYIMYKPYNVLNQFTKERPEHSTLADYLKVEKDVYPVGRLDKDSEGLVLLTNDKQINHLLLSPSNRHTRTYLVQVDGDITQAAVALLMKGVEIKLESGAYKTMPCNVKKLNKTPLLPDRNPPVRFRKLIPTSWIKAEIREGKNRQIRKMCAAVGFPVLRLVRVQIEDIKLGTMQPGEYQSLSEQTVYEMLKIQPGKVKKENEKSSSSAKYSKTRPKSNSSEGTKHQYNKTRKPKKK